MGLTSYPRIFTEVMKPSLAILRQKGHTLRGYLDDFCLQGKDALGCFYTVRESSNYSKSCFFSGKVCFDPHKGDHVLEVHSGLCLNKDEVGRKKKEHLELFCSQTLYRERSFPYSSLID